MPPESTQTLASLSADSQATPHPGSWTALWRIVTHFDSGKMHFAMALRNTAGVAAPLIAGYALGYPRAGLAMAVGALNVSFSDGHDPFAERARRMLTSTLWVSVAVLAGALSGHRNLEAVLVAAIWAFVAGLLVSLGTSAADVGALSTVILVVYAAQSLTPLQAVDSSLLALAGGLLQTGISIALWPVRRYDPERRALASYFLALSRYAKDRPLTDAPPATVESTAAQNALSGLGRDETTEGMRYRSLLNQSERLRVSAFTLIRLRTRIARERESGAAVHIVDQFLENASAMLACIGEALNSGKTVGLVADRLSLSVALTYQLRADAPGPRSTFFSALLQSARMQMDSLSGQLRAALDLASHTSPEGMAAFAKQEASRPLWMRFSSKLATLRGNLNLHSVAFRHAVRLSLCLAAGDALGRAFDWRRSYWIPMTIVLVLKPEFASTFSRGILRIAGTIAGLLAATALFHFLPLSTATFVLLITFFMLLMRWLGPANYGVVALAISGLVVLLLAANGIAPNQVITARGITTAIGGLLALVAYAVWPSWERTRISELFAQLIDAYRESFCSITSLHLDPGKFSIRERNRTRQAARTARSNIEASLDRISAEPGVTSALMNRLNAMLVATHRFALSMIAFEAGVPRTRSQSPRPEFRQFSADVEKTMQLLSSVLRGAQISLKQFPNLREDYNRLIASGDSKEERYALVNVEADRMTNSLNTFRGLVLPRIPQKSPTPS